MNGAGKEGRDWLRVGSGCLGEVVWASWDWRGAEECQGEGGGGDGTSSPLSVEGAREKVWDEPQASSMQCD